MSRVAHPAGRAGLRPMALLVHEASVVYIRDVVEFIRQQLAQYGGEDPLYVECADVAAVPLPLDCVAFIVGDGFPRFARQPRCRYVFVNFSLVRKLRWWRRLSADASRWIDGKYRSLRARADLYDLILDFHPRQTALLARELARASVPVRSFPSAVSAAATGAPPKPLWARQWDVCFTGTDSPRRARLRATLVSRGVHVSPCEAPGLRAVVRDSRLVANVHFVSCDTFEAPRVIEALSAGVCLVTERCHGLADLVPTSCYLEASYDQMAGAITELLRSPSRLEHIGASAATFMREVYAVRAREAWRALVREAAAL